MELGRLREENLGGLVILTSSMVSVLRDLMDLGWTASVAAGVAPTPLGLDSGTVPGLQGPLFWSNHEGSLNTRFEEISSPPFIVLLENRIPGRNLARFNLIALGNLIDSLIPDIKRQILPNGRNQAKAFCDR